MSYTTSTKFNASEAVELLKQKMNRTELIDKLATFPNDLQQLLDGLSEAQLTALALAGEWSVAQNVHHLADSHINGFIRTKLALTEDHPTFKPYNEALWSAMADETHTDFSGSLAILHGVHARWAYLLQTLTDEQWQRAGFHPELGHDESVADLLEAYVGHGEAHLNQMRRTLAAQS